MHQPLSFIDLIRHLFQFRRQGLLGIALNRDRLLIRQPSGDLIDARRQAVAGAFDQVLTHFGRQLGLAVCAQPRQVAEQGVRQHQEAEADVGFLTEMPRLHQHIGQCGGQRRIRVVGVAPRQPISQVVALARRVLLHDLTQVDAVAGQGVGQHLVQAATLPVRQEQEDRQAGDQAAEQGIQQPWQEQPVAIADLVEAEQHHQRDCRRGQGVAGGAVDKEHQACGNGEQRLHQRAWEQIEQRPRHGQTNGSADDPLAKLAPGGAVVGLADEQGGEDDPVTLRSVNGMQGAITDGQRQGEAQGMAEQQ